MCGWKVRFLNDKSGGSYSDRRLGSVVGTTTGYGLNGPGIESRGTIFSTPVQTGPGPTQPPVQWVPGLYRGKERPGSAADHSPPSSTEVKERVELHLYSPLWAFVACSRVNFIFTFAARWHRLPLWMVPEVFADFPIIGNEPKTLFEVL